MVTKQERKYRLWINRHGKLPEKHTCSECGWFVENCLKWSKQTKPFDRSSCKDFQRKANKFIPSKKIQNIKKDAKEEHAYILDILLLGRSDDKRPMYLKKPIVLGVGEKNIVFFEMILRKDISLNFGDRVYIGNGDRQVIDSVERRISYQELTPLARIELGKIIDKLIKANEKKYVKFFNESYWITRKLHILGLLAHINNSEQEKIIKEKGKKQFISFLDIEKRTGISPILAIANRIRCELENSVEYPLFVN